MDMFILLGAGFLGAALIASQSDTPIPFIWKLLFGGLGGIIAWFLLNLAGVLPAVASLGGFIMLVAIGGLTGALGMLVYFLPRRSS